MRNTIVFLIALSAPTAVLAGYAWMMEPAGISVVLTSDPVVNATTANGGLY